MERLVLYVNNNHVLDTNYRIAVYTLQHINAVVDMNIVEMAKACMFHNLLSVDFV